MKLLLNTIPLNPPLTGIGNYTLRLLEQFSHMPDFEDICCFDGADWLTANEALEKQAAAEQQYFAPTTVTSNETTKTIIPAKRSLLYRVAKRVPYAYKAKEWYLDYLLAKKQHTIGRYVYHEPNFIAQSHKGPIVTTIHDLSVLHYPEYHPAARVKWFKEGIADTLKRVDHVLTVSDVVRMEIIEQLNVSPDRVHTTYLAADARFHPRNAEQTQALLTEHGLEHGQYLLFVGTIEPRKGVMDLLDAWEQLPARLREAYPLVLAGGSGWQNEAIMARIHALVATGQVKYLNYITNEFLPVLLAGSLGFVFPAVYEGFGLPVLEAMASGVPVLCRAGTSMAEFAEGAVLLHENHIDSLAEQLGRLIEQADLREQYAAKGLVRAAEFSWQKCAAQTLDVYKRC